ncbi:MAG TPA: sialate O-acetylesterase, partial [Bacillota bacterium]|nr:sialate O-acetylesterase [Bacillota bacterium]
MQLTMKTLKSALSRYLLTPNPGTFPFKLSPLFSDGMVLQRDVPVKIWGCATVEAGVTITFLGRTYQTTAGPDGRWTVVLPAIPTGGPYQMDITSKETTITLKNILIGDVWICGGQSNMVLPMARVNVYDRYAKEIASAENPAIRQFIVSERYDFSAPCQELDSGVWESANPESVLNFTAAGYFFARDLYEKYRVPIGLIKACVGGTPAEAW